MLQVVNSKVCILVAIDVYMFIFRSSSAVRLRSRSNHPVLTVVGGIGVGGVGGRIGVRVGGVGGGHWSGVCRGVGSRVRSSCHIGSGVGAVGQRRSEHRRLGRDAGHDGEQAQSELKG